MTKMFNSKMARVIGAAVATASVAAVVVAVAPSLMPQALAQGGPGSTVPPIGDGLQALIAAIIAFIQRFFALLPFPMSA